MLIQANALHIPLADRSVHCVVTSPPYWGLRKYEGAQVIVWPGASADCAEPEPCAHEWVGNGFTADHPDRSTGGKDSKGSGVFIAERGIQGAKVARGAPAPLGDTCQHCGAWRGQLGLEPTIEMYVAHMVAIFREVRRVLRDDGTLWLNLGDSYATGTTAGRQLGTLDFGEGTMRARQIDRVGTPEGLKTKDLCGIPWRVALALQADGWYLRSDIIWAKPNPMPESVTDRPTKAHEYIFLLTKSQRYFYDADAVREPQSEAALEKYGNWERKGRTNKGVDELTKEMPLPQTVLANGRNMRTVWDVVTQPYAGAHFATFPEEIPYKCIAAGTSEHGVCPLCAAPWERVIEKESPPREAYGRSNAHLDELINKPRINGEKVSAGQKYQNWRNEHPPQTTGWRPTCSCPNLPLATCHRPLVLDPFGGSGTVGEVALKMGRGFILLDLAYQHLQVERIGMFARL